MRDTQADDHVDQNKCYGKPFDFTTNEAQIWLQDCVFMYVL